MNKVVVKVIMAKLSDIISTSFQGRRISMKDDENDGTTKRGLDDLTSSIERNGMLEPISVRKAAGEKFEIIDGHRRWIVATRLGMKRIPAIVRQFDDKQAQLLAVIANIERQDLTPIEMAGMFVSAIDSGVFENKMDLANHLGKTESWVREIINTLDMDTRVIEDIEKNRTIADFRILRAIRSYDKLNHEKKSDKQLELYEKIKAGNMSRAAVLEYTKSPAGEKQSEGAPALTFTRAGKASLKFDASTLDSEKRTELEREIMALIQKFLEANESVKEVPAAA